MELVRLLLQLRFKESEKETLAPLGLGLEMNCSLVCIFVAGFGGYFVYFFTAKTAADSRCECGCRLQRMTFLFTFGGGPVGLEKLKLFWMKINEHSSVCFVIRRNNGQLKGPQLSKAH